MGHAGVAMEEEIMSLRQKNKVLETTLHDLWRRGRSRFRLRMFGLSWR